MIEVIHFGSLVSFAPEQLFTALGALASSFKTPAQLRLENLALRQQLDMLRRSATKSLELTSPNRLFGVSLRSVWGGWKSAV